MDEVLLIGAATAKDETVVRLLEREQWAVFRAADAQTGLATARTAQPAIVIADDPVEDYDGLALLREVRALAPACEVILVTDVAGMEGAMEALRAGALDYLHRPIDQELLRVALGRARERRPHRPSMEPPVILLMEDYEPTLRQLARVLETEGYLVYAAPNGEDGMRLFDQHRVDIILADLAMPRKDGLTVLREAKAREPDVEVIVVTGCGNEDAVVEALRQGAINFLKKPVDIEQMLLAIQKALDFQTVRRSLAYRNRDTQIMQELVVRLTRELELVVETPSRINSRTLDFAHQLVDFLPIGIVVADSHCGVQFANRHIVEKVGGQPPRLSAEWLKLVGIHNVTDEQLEEALLRTSGLKPGSIETLMVSRWAFLVMTPLKLVRPGGTDRLVAVAVRGERGDAGTSRSLPPEPKRGRFVDAEEELSLKDAAMAASLTGVVIASLDGRVIYVNDTCLRLTGWKLDEVLGQKIGDVLPYGQSVVDTVLHDGSFVGEFAHPRPDGTVVHAQVSVNLVRDSSGAPVAGVATIADITSLKGVEQELRLKDAAMDASLSGILIAGMDGRIRYVNDAQVKLTGYTREELVGQLALELFPGGQPVIEADRIVEAVGREGSFVGQVDLRRKDGTVYHVQLAVNIVRDSNGVPVASVATMSDISPLKRAEQELRLKDAAIEASLACVLIAGMDGRIQHVNDAYVRLSGYCPDELVGHQAMELFPEGQPIVDAVMRDGSFIGQVEHRAKDGTLSHVQLSVNLIRDSSGMPVASVSTMSDISSLKRAERELRLKDAAIAIAANGIAMVDLQGNFTYVNDAFVKLCGYEREELVGTPVTSSLGESATPTLETLLRDGYASGEEALRRKDGAVIPIHATSSVIPDESGCPVALMISFVDLTEIKQAEAELRLRDAAMASSLNAILIGGLDGRIRYVNDAFVRLFGYGREEVVGRLPVDLFPEGQAAVDGLRRDGKFMGEIEHRHRSGETLHIQVTVNLVRDANGNPVASVATMTDLTDLKRAEAELRLRDAAMGASLNAILIGGLDGRIRYVNDAYVRMFGYAREEVIGRLPGDLFPEGQAAVEGLQRDGKFMGEIEHRHKSGAVLHVQIAVNLIRDARGVPVASVATMADVTALRHAEQNLAHRTQELERSNRELEQFAYVASHDLQEPLRMVSSYTQLLAKRYQDRLDSDANDFIAYAVGGANRMQRLINDLLAYSRVNTQGKVPKPVDSHVALGHALANLAAAIEDQQGMVTNDDLPVVSADETQLVQVFQNLIGNALKFRGGEAPRVHVSAERRPGGWLFSVRDNGIGIAGEFHPRLFQIFQRLHGKDVPGTGIGLALCKRIVERHGGTIWVESEAGRGATFCFTLPR